MCDFDKMTSHTVTHGGGAGRVCGWTQTEDGQWDTGCGEVFEFVDAGPEENGFAFCPYCGYGIALKDVLYDQNRSVNDGL